MAAGVARGTRSLGDGVLQGVTGLLVQPARGLRESGLKGLALGIGKGIVGVAVKPAAGVLDLFSRTAQGVANQTQGTSRRHRVPQHRTRPPRMLFGEKKVVREYVHAEAAAHDVLADFRAGKHRREPLTSCVTITPRRELEVDLAILTDRRLLLAVWSSKRVLRHISLEDLERFEPAPVDGDSDGSSLLLTTRQREPWQATVSDTQQQMRACFGPRRSRWLVPTESPARGNARVQLVRLECGSKAVCDEFVHDLGRAVALHGHHREKQAQAWKGSNSSSLVHRASGSTIETSQLLSPHTEPAHHIERAQPLDRDDSRAS